METVETIKSLYKSFKESTGSKRSEFSKLYIEAVENEFKNNKKNIISGPYLEYIVSSSQGMKLFNSFLENYGLPICEFDKVYKILTNKKNLVDQSKAITKNQDKEIMFESYSKLIAQLDNFKARWENAFLMFEHFKKKGINYSEIYYENVLNGAKTPLKFLSKFGESVIPDLMIGAYSLKQNRVLYEGLINNPTFFNRKLGQWIFESAKYSVGKKNIIKKLYNLSLEPLMAQLEKKEMISFCESLVNRSLTPNGLKTENNLKLIYDYIEVKKFIAESTENVDVCVSLVKQIDKAKELGTNLEDSALVVSDYLQTPVIEGLFDQSSDKRPGDIPDYIKKNYDTDYDGKKDEDSEAEDSIDEPNVDKSEISDDSLSAYRRIGSDSSSDDLKDSDDTTDDSDNTNNGKKGNIYYYNYNYNNSFNQHHDSSTNYSDQRDSSTKYSDNRDYSNNSISQHGNVSYNKSDRNGNDNRNWQGNSNIEVDSFDKSTGGKHDALKQEIRSALDKMGRTRSDKDLNESFSLTAMESTCFFFEGESDKQSSVSSNSTEKISDKRPESDNPLRDQINDVKTFGQKVGNVFKTIGKGFNDIVVEPSNKVVKWITDLIQFWKTKSDNQVKEELADPSKQWNLWSNIKRLFALGIIIPAGPLVWALSIYYAATEAWSRRSANKARLLHEMEHELPAEIDIVKKKIERAESNKDYQKADQLRRIQGQLEKTLENIKGKNMVVDVQR